MVMTARRFSYLIFSSAMLIFASAFIPQKSLSENGMQVEDGQMNINSGRFEGDHTPPTVTLSIPAPTGKNGWYNAPVSVLVRAWDGGSGVVSAQVSLGGKTWYKRALAIREDGTYLVMGKAVDRAGNVATISTLIKVDMTAPEIVFNVPEPDGKSEWYVDSVHFSLNGTDNLSGVFKTDLYAQGSFDPSTRSLLDVQETYQEEEDQVSQYLILGESNGEADSILKLTQSGEYLVTGYVEDVAGNRTPVETRVSIDVTPPQITFSSPNQMFGMMGLTGSLEEYESGISGVWIDEGAGWEEADFGSSTWQTSWQTRGLKDGKLTIRAKVVDGAGNYSIVNYPVTVVNHIWPILAFSGIVLSLGLIALYDPRRRAVQELTLILAKYSRMERNASQLRKESKND